MKKGLLTLFVLFNFVSFIDAQNLDDNYDLNFDDSIGIQHVFIDTIFNPNNIWQIGSPQKNYFVNANSFPNVIVTDTINSYPVNDTSVFIITNVASGMGFQWPHTVIVSGQYFVNSDSLSDFGMIEFSPDNGSTWIDIVNDTNYSNSILWYSVMPVFTGNSNGWLNFYANIAGIGPIFNVQDGDTILYRFSFISDSVQTNKDGLMFDDLHFEDWVEGIEEEKATDLISIYPNPATIKLSIRKKVNTEYAFVQIFNYIGKEVYSNSSFVDDHIILTSLDNGIYILRYMDKRGITTKKFIVNR